MRKGSFSKAILIVVTVVLIVIILVLLLPRATGALDKVKNIMGIV